MTDAQWQTVRTVLAFRLINLPPSYIAGQLGISTKAVQRILLDHGNVERRGNRRMWRRSFSVTDDVRAEFKLPDYIHSHSDGACYHITNRTAWSVLTKDAPHVTMPDGRRMLHTFDGPPVEPFYPSQGGPSVE